MTQLPAVPPSTSSRGAPRHAGILPSFCVPYVSRPFTTWAGDIHPDELLDWTRAGLPTAGLANDIRQNALKRLRANAPQFLAEAVCVVAPAGWENALGSDDVATLKRALGSLNGRQLEAVSLLDLRRAARIPYSDLLGVLARLEALDWQRKVRASSMPHSAAASAQRRDSPFDPQEPWTDALRDLVGQALALPWVERVAAGDLRLCGLHAGAAPAKWLREILTRPSAPANVREVAEGLLAADAMTYAEELATIGRMAARLARRRLQPDQVDRWQAIYSRRYASPVRPRTLREVGDEFGLTRERIRQMCEMMTEVLRSGPLATPALDRVIRMAARAAPCTVAEVDFQLQRHLGQDAGVLSALEFADVLGTHDILVQASTVRVRMSGRYEHAPILERADEQQRWSQRCLSYAAGECTTLGCTSILRMAGRLSLEDGIALDSSALESALAASPGFVWLDRESGWFSVGSTVNSGAASRLKKILAVALEPVSVDEVAEAFACDTRWFRDDHRSLSIPPTFVIQAMARNWPFVKALQYTRFQATQPIAKEDVLSDVERLAVEIIERGDGLAPAWHIYEECTRRLDVTRMAVSITLASSPILVRFEFGLYALRGRRFKSDALSKARTALAQKLSRSTDEGDPSAFRVTVSAACVDRNEQYTVPARMRALVAGRTIPLIGMEPLTLRFSNGGSMRGVRRAFPGLQPGQVLEVRLHADGVSIEQLHADASSAARAES